MKKNTFSLSCVTQILGALFLFSVFSPLLLSANDFAQSLAPSEATMQAKLSGQTINDITFISATRFNWQGEPGNWSYQQMSGTVAQSSHRA